jgi:hypothetical protein
LLEHLLSAAVNQLIKQIAPFKSLMKMSRFHLDLALTWHAAFKIRSLNHGVSSKPSLGS